MSGYDSNVALAIVSSTDFTGLVVAILVPAIPAILNLVSLVTLADIATPGSRSRKGKALLLIIIAPSLFLFARSWLELVIYFGIPAVQFALFAYWDRKRNPAAVGAENTRLALSFVLTSTLALVLSSSVWLPPERIVVTGKATTAYVLHEDDRYIVAFFSYDNVVRRYSVEEISERQYCVQNPPFSFRKSKRAGRPVCPKQSK